MAFYSSNSKQCAGKARSIVEKNFLLVFIICIQREYKKVMGRKKVFSAMKFIDDVCKSVKSQTEGCFDFNNDKFIDKKKSSIIGIYTPKKKKKTKKLKQKQHD